MAQTRSRSLRSSMTVAPGGWIKVAVPEAWPLEMQIGPLARKRVFLDREDGQVFAATRCPDLTPATYPVRVFAGGTVIETAITVQ